MKAEGRDAALLWDMIDAASKASMIVERLSREAYLADGIAQLAIDHGRLWQVATADVPKLIIQLRQLLPPKPD